MRPVAMLVMGAGVLAAMDGYGKTVPSPTMSQLATSWVGNTDSEAVRIDLGPDGTGRAAIIFVPTELARPSTYRITGTKLTGTSVTFSMEAVEEKDEPVLLSGGAWIGGMTLTLRATRGRWKRRLQLERLSDLQERLRALDASISQVEPTR